MTGSPISTFVSSNQCSRKNPVEATVANILSEFSLPSNSICSHADIHPFLVFEKTTPSFLTTTNVKMDTPYLGALHPTRLSKILGVHVVQASSKQVYVGKRLDKTPHYQVPVSEITEFIDRAVSAGIDVIAYSSRKSHIYEDDFLTVLNEGTPEWSAELEDKVDCLFADSALSHLMSQKECERGNIQVACGFTSQNYDDSAKQGYSLVEKPALTKATTMEYLTNMINLSEVCKYLEGNISTCEAMFDDNDRNEIFAFDIGRRLGHDQPKKNTLEGYTMALTRESSNLLKCHLDTMNDTATGYNYVVVASSILGRKSPTLRVSHIGYGRSCCRHYMHRSRKTLLFCDDLKAMLAETPKKRKDVCPELYPRDGNEFKEMTPHFNKNVYYSTFASAIMRLHQKYKLTKNQSIELLYAVSFFNGSWLYWRILNEWHKNGIPRNGTCLSVEILMAAVGEGGVSTGKYRRHQCSFNQAITLKQIYTNLRRLKKVLHAADDKYKGDTRWLITSLSKKESDGGLLHCGMLTAQHLIQVAVLVGIVTTTTHNVNAEISDGTLLRKRLEQYGCYSREQCCRLLRDASRCINKTEAYTENAMCENLKKDGSSFDVVYKDETIMDTRNLGHGLVVVEMRKDGSVIERKQPVWADSSKGECCDKWWEENFTCQSSALYSITVKKVVRSNGRKGRRNPRPPTISTKHMRHATRVQRLHSRITMQSKWAAKPLPPLVTTDLRMPFEQKSESSKKRVALKINHGSKRYRTTDDLLCRDVWMNRLPINSSSRTRFPNLIGIRSKVYAREYPWKRVDLFFLLRRVLGCNFQKRNISFPGSPKTICGKQGWVASTILKGRKYSTSYVRGFPNPSMKMSGVFYYKKKQKAIDALLIFLLCEMDPCGQWVNELMNTNDGVVLCHHYREGPMDNCAFGTMIKHCGSIYILDHDDETSYRQRLRLY